MKTRIYVLSLLMALAVASPAQAQDEVGNIVSVTQLLADRTVSEQVCDTTHPTAAAPGSAINSGTVIGGIAGALLGSQAGDGNGRVAMAALGAVTGALSGNRIANAQPQRTCRIMQRTVQQVGGYLVTYEFNGKTYQATTSYDPSRGGTTRSVPVNVTVALR